MLGRAYRARLPLQSCRAACSRSATGTARCRAQRMGSQRFNARDILATSIRVVTIGKGNSSAAEAMAEEWQKKVARYAKFEHVNLKGNPKRANDPAVQMGAEASKLLQTLAPRDFVVVLDERGLQCTSYDMANLLAQAGDRNAASIVFCIGGPFGHTDEVRARADQTISLSSCVLNHQVARVVLLEQIYRAWTIVRNEPYHH